MPEAVINMLALLGWNPGNDQELMSMDELINLFSIDKISKAGAKFSLDKAKWFNHEYILMKPAAKLRPHFRKILHAMKFTFFTFCHIRTSAPHDLNPFSKSR